VGRHSEWLRIYDSSPVADIDHSAAYCKETSDDGGRTWEFPRAMTGEQLQFDMTDALLAGCAVDHQSDLTTIQNPHPGGGLIRYTLTDTGRHREISKP